MMELATAEKGRYAPVSADIPLLSNLSVFRNIALIRQYHERLGREESHRLTTEALERFGLCGIAEKRPYDLSERDLFLVKLLRAAQRKEALIVIDRPFVQIAGLRSFEWIRKHLELLDFPGIDAIILDYEWNGERYGSDGA
ncbi:MAG TPA: hypothetical protein PKH10_02675 [bacterium]|nr:hypothetical protein [bacterium]